MGALGSLIISLFSFCFKKLSTKKEIKTRIVVLSLFAGVFLIISILFAIFGTTAEDREGGWLFVFLYIIFFGWRLIADIFCYFNRKYEK